MSKALLKSVLPSSTYSRLVHTYRGWLASRSYQRAGVVANKLVAKYGAQVHEGPFKGMKLRLDAIGSAVSPKLVGSYESEVHAAIEAIVSRGYSRVLNIGSAEGYYAVGLAYRMPRAEVWAFDIEAAALTATKALATLNGVESRVHVEGECTHARLDALCTEDTVIICDIEGAEKELLDPARSAGLQRADVLVEIHPTETGERLEDLLAARFAATHVCEMIPTAPRSGGDYPWLADGLSPTEIEIALSEFRPFMHWGFFQRRR